MTIPYRIKKTTTYLSGPGPGLRYKVLLETDSLPTIEVLKEVALEIWKDNNNIPGDILFYLDEMDLELAAYGLVVMGYNRNIRDAYTGQTGLIGTKWDTSEDAGKWRKAFESQEEQDEDDIGS